MLKTERSWSGDLKPIEVTKQFTGIAHAFVEFFDILFFYLKYIFVTILIFIGISTLLNYKFFKEDSKNPHRDFDEKDRFFNKLRVFFGFFSLFAGIGILFNYFLYLLIFLLEPISDQYIFNLLNLLTGQDEFLNYFSEIPHDNDVFNKCLYYCFALGSFEANLRLFTLSYFLLSRKRKIVVPNKAALILVESLIQALLFGFTTYLKLFL
ncbi:MAG: hypothetical protein R6U96_11870 [Promethearchaeia archaeon]